MEGKARFSCSSGKCTFTQKKGDKIYISLQNSASNSYNIAFSNNVATNSYLPGTTSMYNLDTSNFKLTHTETGQGAHIYVSVLNDFTGSLFSMSPVSSSTGSTSTSGSNSTSGTNSTSTGSTSNGSTITVKTSSVAQQTYNSTSNPSSATLLSHFGFFIFAAATLAFLY